MRILLGLSLVGLCCLLNAVEPPKTSPEKIPDKPTGIYPDNSKFGLFVGVGINYESFNFSTQTDKTNLFTYDVDIKDNPTSGHMNLGGFGFEARAGFIKTFSILGIRVYGLYGKGGGSGKTIGKKPQILDSKDSLQQVHSSLTESLDISKTYYGGVIDFMLGNFIANQKSFYVFLGGGYVLNNYSLDGKMAFGDEPTKNDPKASFLFLLNHENYYSAQVYSKATTGNVLLNAGAGMFFFRHLMVECNFRFMFGPDFFSNSTLRYENNLPEPFINDSLKYANQTPILIKNSLNSNVSVNINLILVF